MAKTPEALLSEAVSSPHDRYVIDSLAQHAEEMRAFLDDPDRTAFWAAELLKSDAVWAERVFGAIAGQPEQMREEPKEFVSLLGAYVEDQRAVGRAFQEALLVGVPGGLSPLLQRLEKYPTVEEDLQEELLSDPDVEAAPDSERLLPYGLTPLAVFGAIDAVAALAKRAFRRGVLPRSRPVRLSRDGLALEDGTPRVAAESLTGEMAAAADSSEEVASVLLEWLIAVAHTKHYLFPGFRATPAGEDVLLQQTSRRFPDLLHRWSETESE